MAADDPALRRRSFALNGARAVDPPQGPRPSADEIADAALQCLANGASSGAMRTAPWACGPCAGSAPSRATDSGHVHARSPTPCSSVDPISRDPDAWAESARSAPDQQRRPAGRRPGTVPARSPRRELRRGLRGRPRTRGRPTALSRRPATTGAWGWPPSSSPGWSRHAATTTRRCVGSALAEHHLRAISAVEDLTQVQVLRAVGRVVAGDVDAEHTLAAIWADPELETMSRAQAALGLAAGLAARGRDEEAAAWSSRALRSQVDEFSTFAQSRVLFRVVDALIRIRRGDDVAPALAAAVPETLTTRDAPVLGTLASASPSSPPPAATRRPPPSCWGSPPASAGACRGSSGVRPPTPCCRAAWPPARSPAPS